MHRSALVAAALALASCFTPHVTVVATGAPLQLAPRPRDCKIEFYRVRPPDRAFDEFATLRFEGRGNPESAQERMREKACEIGADAVMVSQEYYAMMTGIAVSYPELRAKHRVEGAVRRAAEVQWLADRRASERKRFPSLPDGYLPADVPAEALARERPDRLCSKFTPVPAGADAWMSPGETNGHRRVWWRGQFVGWIESDQLKVAGPPPIESPPAAAPGRGSGPPAAPGTEI